MNDYKLRVEVEQKVRSRSRAFSSPPLPALVVVQGQGGNVVVAHDLENHVLDPVTKAGAERVGGRGAGEDDGLLQYALPSHLAPEEGTNLLPARFPLYGQERGRGG